MSSKLKINSGLHVCLGVLISIGMFGCAGPRMVMVPMDEGALAEARLDQVSAGGSGTGSPTTTGPAGSETGHFLSEPDAAPAAIPTGAGFRHAYLFEANLKGANL